MKNWILGIAGVGITIVLGCGNPAKKDSKALVIEDNNHRDSADISHPNSEHEISGADAKFAVEAADGGRAEVELGKLAMERATSAAVRNFGAMMVRDHSKANADLKQLVAARKNIALPDSLGKDEQKIKNELAGTARADFDKAYVEAMIKDHQQDIKTFELARNVAKYPEFVAFIDKNLPVLKMHLHAIQKIHDQLK